MPEPLDEQYFVWLSRTVASVRLKNPARTHWALLRQLFTKEFVWQIANDDNREADGRDLRSEFLEETGLEGDWQFTSTGCSMLEMLIALSRRLSYEDLDNKPTDAWFWQLMQNLRLDDYTDKYHTNVFTAQLVDDILDAVIQRTYDADGTGSLFPLEHPQKDQRYVELWVQMGLYLIEHS